MEDRDMGRMESFSDGVIAVIITITVLGLRVPPGASLAALAGLFPTFLIYLFSFQTIGTYWINHHHLIRRASLVTPKVMWANLSLLFWMSFIPFSTEWLGAHVGATTPSVVYAGNLLVTAMAYTVLQKAIAASAEGGTIAARLLQSTRKGVITLGSYVLAVAAAFFLPWLSYALITMVALLWFVPDRRLKF